VKRHEVQSSVHKQSLSVNLYIAHNSRRLYS